MQISIDSISRLPWPTRRQVLAYLITLVLRVALSTTLLTWLHHYTQNEESAAADHSATAAVASASASAASVASVYGSVDALDLFGNPSFPAAMP